MTHHSARCVRPSVTSSGCWSYATRARTGRSSPTAWGSSPPEPGGALAQRDEPKQRPPRLEDLLELLSEALDVEVVHLVAALARLIEERAKEDDVSRARHHGSLALEAANASDLHFVILSREDATVLIEGAPR